MRHGVVAGLRTCVGLALVGATLLALASAASAETYNASNTEQFLEAVAKANANPGANTIVLAGSNSGYLPQSTVKFTNTTGPLTIEGPTSFPGAKLVGSAVEPFPSDLFVVTSGASVTFKNVLISRAGGGVHPAIEDIGNLSIEDSTVAGNKAVGVLVGSGATATVTNSTLSDGAAGGLVNDGTTSLLNATVAFNKGIGLENKGTLSLANTIVAENGGASCVGAATTSDHSLDSDGTCGVGALSNTNPQLQEELLNDGGSTPLHSEKPTSPTIDAGDEAVCPATDQRGQPRPDVPGTPCDIGADEYSPVPPTITVPSEIVTPQTSPAGATVTYTASATTSHGVVRHFSCSPASGSTFPVGTTTVTCTATDGHENTSTASFQVTVLLHFEFTNWAVSGFITPKKLNQQIVLPAGSTFNGSTNLNLETETGAVTGSFSFPAFTSTVKLLGISTTLGLELNQVATTSGSIAPSKEVPGDITLSLPTNLNLSVTSLKFFGLTISTKCTTSSPLALNLASNLTIEELLSTGASFTGTTNIPKLKCEGILGPLEASILSAVLSSSNSPYSIAIAPPV